MNPPRRWPLDPRRRQAPRPRPGRFAARRSPHDPHHHQPPAHGGDLRPRHGTRPPLARRWRRARLPPALGLDGPRRPHRHSSHHGPRLAACRVVAHRDEGITAISTAPRPFRPGRGGRKIRARQWPRPVFKANSRTTEAVKQISRATVARCFGPNGTAQLGTARHAMPDGRPWTWDVVELPSDLSACLPNLNPSRPYRVL